MAKLNAKIKFLNARNIMSATNKARRMFNTKKRLVVDVRLSGNAAPKGMKNYQILIRDRRRN